MWALRALVAIVLLVLLARRIDLHALGDAVLGVDAGYLIASCVVLAVTQFVAVGRLQLLLRPTEIRIGSGRLLVVELIARFYGMFLPSGVGRGIARWYKVTRGVGHKATFAVVTVVEKAMLLLTTALCVGIPLLITSGENIRPIRLAAAPIVVAVLALVVVVFGATLTSAGNRIAARIVERLRAWTNAGVVDRMAGAVESLSIYRGKWGLVSAGLAATAGMQAMILLRIGLLIAAVHVDLSWLTILWLGSLVFMLQTLPISIAGIGVRESMFAFAFSRFDLDPDRGVLVGLLFFAQIIVLAAIGGLLELTDRERPRPPRESQ